MYIVYVTYVKNRIWLSKVTYLIVDLFVRLKVTKVDLFECKGPVQCRLLDVETAEQLLPAAFVVDLKFQRK